MKNKKVKNRDKNAQKEKNRPEKLERQKDRETSPAHC
jgi:hypothetical protein